MDPHGAARSQRMLDEINTLIKKQNKVLGSSTSQDHRNALYGTQDHKF